MDYAAIISAAISAAGAIGVAIVGVHQYREKAARDIRLEETERREALRNESSLIQLEMLQAQLKLGKVTAKAVMNQTLNGDVAEAWEWVRKVEIKYAELLRRIAQEM